MKAVSVSVKTTAFDSILGVYLPHDANIELFGYKMRKVEGFEYTLYKVAIEHPESGEVLNMSADMLDFLFDFKREEVTRELAQLHEREEDEEDEDELRDLHRSEKEVI